MDNRKLSHYMALLGVVAFLLIACLYWSAGNHRNVQRRSSCQSNLKQIALAVAQYAQDFEGRFPPKVVGNTRVVGWSLSDYSGLPVGWADALQPQLRTESRYLCPEAPPRPMPTLRHSQRRARQSGYTDYWLNANLSGVTKKAVVAPTATLLVGEGNDGTDKTDATYSKSRLPPAWLTNKNSPAWRHMGGANYLFADGHVAWLRPNEVTNCYRRTNCFALK